MHLSSQPYDIRGTLLRCREETNPQKVVSICVGPLLRVGFSHPLYALEKNSSSCSDSQFLISYLILASIASASAFDAFPIQFYNRHREVIQNQLELQRRNVSILFQHEVHISTLRSKR